MNSNKYRYSSKFVAEVNIRVNQIIYSKVLTFLEFDFLMLLFKERFFPLAKQRQRFEKNQVKTITKNKLPGTGLVFSFPSLLSVSTMLFWKRFYFIKISCLTKCLYVNVLKFKFSSFYDFTKAINNNIKNKIIIKTVILIFFPLVLDELKSSSKQLTLIIFVEGLLSLERRFSSSNSSLNFGSFWARKYFSNCELSTVYKIKY